LKKRQCLNNGRIEALINGGMMMATRNLNLKAVSGNAVSDFSWQI